MENLLVAIFSNINPVDVIFPTLFIGVSSSQIKNIFFIWVMAASFYKVVRQDIKARKNNEDFTNDGSPIEPIYLKSDQGIQTERNYSIKALHKELTDKFRRIQTIEEMEDLYGKELVDLYFETNSLSRAHPDFLHMGMECEKNTRLAEVVTIYRVYRILGYTAPDELDSNLGSRTPTASSVDSPTPSTSATTVPSSSGNQSTSSVHSTNLGANPFGTYAYDIAFLCRNHPGLLESYFDPDYNLPDRSDSGNTVDSSSEPTPPM